MHLRAILERLLNLPSGARVVSMRQAKPTDFEDTQAQMKDLETVCSSATQDHANQLIRELQEQLTEVQKRAQEMEEKLNDLEVANAQLGTVVRQLGGLLPPPRHLQVRTHGGYVSVFVESGEEAVANIKSILEPTGHSLRSFESILDFGSGCGRIATAMRQHLPLSTSLFGTDIDPEAIEWCRANYASVAEFGINDPMPPLRYADNSFDFVYCYSVFTHLPEEMQFAWLSELRRVTQPGGYLILSTHGDNHYHHIPEQYRINELGFLYLKLGSGTKGLPDFYRSSWHTHEYIRSRWAEYFDVLDIRPYGFGGRQDAVLCRNRT